MARSNLPALLLLLTAVSSAPAAPEAAPAGASTLVTFSAGSHGPLAYEVGIGRCTESSCKFEVRLVQNEVVRDTLTLDWPGSSGQLTRGRADQALGAGDPLTPERDLDMWTTGEENSAVSVAARSIDLTPSVRGLVVYQSAGFEHVRRRYYLFVVLDSKLVRAWTGTEGEAPETSTLDITKAGEREQLTFWRFPPADGGPNRWSRETYRWSDEHRRLERAADPSPVFAVAMPGFETVAQARKVASKFPDCLASYIVLDRRAFMSRVAGRFVLAGLSSRRDQAVRTVASVTECTGGRPTAVLQVAERRPASKE